MIEQAATITEDILEGAGVPKANILVEQLKVSDLMPKDMILLLKEIMLMLKAIKQKHMVEHLTLKAIRHK